MNTAQTHRPLEREERTLARWMLEHGRQDARQFIQQLENAEATMWRWVCGCASFNFEVAGHPEAPPGVHILGDYVFGGDSDLAGVFIFESGGILSGVEVYGLAGEAPQFLPRPEQLRPFEVALKPISEKQEASLLSPIPCWRGGRRNLRTEVESASLKRRSRNRHVEAENH